MTSDQREDLGAAGCQVFGKEGGTIGRAPENDWVLPDPERYVSSQHATIFHRDGDYYLCDNSKNGVIVNRSSVPVGQGNSVKLNDGDLLTIGDYEIAVSVGEIAEERLVQPPRDDHVIRQEPSGRGLGTPQPRAPESADLWDLLPSARPDDVPEMSLEAEQEGPLEPEHPAAEPDHTPSVEEFFAPPHPAAGLIPEDWAAPAPPRETPAPSEPTPEIPSAPRAEAPQPIAEADALLDKDDRGEEQALRAFIEGAGLDVARLSDCEVVETMATLGKIFREVMQGLMELLRARTGLKSEFRMELTSIRPVENNPLKFSPDVDEALERLLFRPGRGYLPPMEAVHESLQDIKDHQFAMLQGLRAAFRGLMKRFDPGALQHKFDAELQRGVPFPRRRSRYWDLYTALYEALAREAEDDFQALFGEEFARAYEEQIRRLANARRASKE